MEENLLKFQVKLSNLAYTGNKKKLFFQVPIEILGNVESNEDFSWRPQSQPISIALPWWLWILLLDLRRFEVSVTNGNSHMFVQFEKGVKQNDVGI